MKKSITIALFALMALLMTILPVRKSFGQQQETQQRVTELESRVTRLQNEISQHVDSGISIFLCGVFCALWAQNTGRSAWLWFFVGLFFNVITLIVLLSKNSNDRGRNRAAHGTSGW